METKIKRTARRTDAWTVEDDKRLAETVLQHIRTGSTQLRAFTEAGQQLGRTSAACGFRWNGVLRKQYVDELKAAKTERKKPSNKFQVESRRSPELNVAEPILSTESETLKGVIGFLTVYEHAYRKLECQATQLRAECDALKEQLITIRHHAREQDKPGLKFEQLEADTRMLMEIMGRTRKVVGSTAALKQAD